MKNLIYTLSFLILVLSFNLTAFSQTSHRIYLNPLTGNDSYTGRDINYPIQTLTRAGQVAVGGDTVFIRGGHYYAFKQVFQRSNMSTGYITIMPYFNETVILDGAGAVFQSWDAIFAVQSSSYVNVLNLNVMNNNNGAGIRIISDIDTSKYIYVFGCKVSYVYRQGILVQAKNVTVDSCDISNAVQDNINSTSTSGWESALATYLYPRWLGYCSNIIFRRNHVDSCWGEGIGLVRAKNFTIENNVVHDVFSCGIYMDNSVFGNVRNNLVYISDSRHNRWYTTSYYAPACGIYFAAEGDTAYCADSTVEGINIYNNLILGTNTAIGWFYDLNNSYIHNSYKNINISYNTISRTCGWETFYLDPNIYPPNRIPPSGCTFRNNILGKGFYGGTPRSYFTTSTDYNLFAGIDHNCFINGDTPPISTSSISGYPGFADSSAKTAAGFQIPINSNCRNQGITISGITTDYWNRLRFPAPCIGFHEYGASSSINNINNQIPGGFKLYQNYPNPFNPNTNIRFDLSENSFVRLSLFNMLGQEIETLLSGNQKAGSYEVSWNAEKYTSGLYFYKLETENFNETKKMLLIK